MSDDPVTEALARAWIACDPNRGCQDPDALIQGGPDLHGKPQWMWFIPRAEAMRDFLAERGYVLRPKERA